MKLILPLFLIARLAFASGGVPVSPDTPSSYIPPTGPPKEAKLPPECVKRTLDVIYAAEKDFFATKKTYSTSYIEMHAASKIGVGCPGWDLPAIELTYGGAGFKAVMTEETSGNKWIINHDHALYAEEKEKPRK